MYILIDVYDNTVVCNREYKNLEDAKLDLDAEFYCFTSDDNDIEYGSRCCQSKDRLSAWAKLKGKYRLWQIVEIIHKT